MIKKKAIPKYDTSHYFENYNYGPGAEYPDLCGIGHLNIAETGDDGLINLNI